MVQGSRAHRAAGVGSIGESPAEGRAAAATTCTAPGRGPRAVDRVAEA